MSRGGISLGLADSRYRFSRGEKLRRAAASAATRNGWSVNQMQAVPGWQPSTVYTLGQMVVNGGRIYVQLSSSGTSASSGGPTRTAIQTLQGGQSDGTCNWAYWADATITTDPSRTLVTRTASTAVSLGDYVVVDNARVYRVVAAGTTASGAGPTGTSNSVSDGTATYTYLGPLTPNPAAPDFPTVTQGTSVPSGLPKIYRANEGDTFSAQAAFAIAGGSGYAVGDTITLAGGTSTQAVVVRVTSVSAGAVRTVSIVTAGSYTVLPTAVMTQASTSGSGTGATIDVGWTDPSWCRVHGGMIFGRSGPQVNIFNMQPSAGASVRGHSNAYEFWTDAPRFAFILTSNNAAAVTMYIDGVRFNLNRLAPNASTQYVEVTFPGGRRPRLIRIEQNSNLNINRVIVDNYSTVWKPTDEVPRLVLVSDSIADGAAFSNFVPGNTLALQLGHALGCRDAWSLAIGGTGYVNPGTADTFRSRVPQILALNPDIVVLFGSTNDIGQSGVTAAVTGTLQDLRAGGYTGPIVVFGVISVNSSATSTEALVKAGFDAFVDPLSLTFWVPISYASPFPWLTGAWNNNPSPAGFTDTQALSASVYINTNDNVHQSDRGTVFLASQMAAAIRSGVLPRVA